MAAASTLAQSVWMVSTVCSTRLEAAGSFLATIFVLVVAARRIVVHAPAASAGHEPVASVVHAPAASVGHEPVASVGIVFRRSYVPKVEDAVVERPAESALSSPFSTSPRVDIVSLLESSELLQHLATSDCSLQSRLAWAALHCVCCAAVSSAKHVSRLLAYNCFSMRLLRLDLSRRHVTHSASRTARERQLVFLTPRRLSPSYA